MLLGIIIGTIIGANISFILYALLIGAKKAERS